MARNFVASEVITFPVPAALIGVDGGPLTIVAVYKVNSSAYNVPIYTKTSTTHAWWVEVDTTGGLHVNYGTGTTPRNVGTISTGAYMVGIFRKDASGSFQPVGRYLTGAGFTTDSGNITAVSTLIDGPALDSGGLLQFGRWGPTDYSVGMDLAAVAVWNSYVADGTVPGFTTWANILTASPTYWAKFESSTVTDSASQSPTITGTSVVADPSGFFGAADQNVTGNGIVTGAAVGAATISATYTINANGINSNERLGATQLSATYTINASGISSKEAIGNTTVSATYTVNVNGIASTERLGTASLSATSTISAGGIASTERAGSPAVTPGSVSINASGVGSSEQLGTPTIQNITQITPSGIGSTEVLGNSTISSTYTINASGIETTERSGSTAVSSVVSGSGIATSERLGLPTFSLTVSPAGIRSDAQLGAATVQPGVVTINASAITPSEALGTVTVILAQSIAAAGIETASAVGSATITVGPATINASGIVSSESLGNAQLGVSVTPAGIPSSEGVGSPTISVTAAGISAGNIASSERVGSPTITTSVTISVHGIRTEERFGSNTLYRQIVPGGIGSTEKLGSPTVTVGAATINASGILSAAAFGTPIITANPLVPPTPQTLIKIRIGQTVLSDDAGQSTVRVNDAETLIAI